VLALLALPGARRARSADDLGDTLSAAVVPENWAGELLGDGDLEVARPGSVKDAASELRGLVKDGKLQPGVGVELTPWNLWVGRSMTFEQYRGRNGWERAWRNLARSSLALATMAAGEGAAAPVRGAAALRLRLWDDSDWRLNDRAIECALKVIAPADPGSSPPTGQPPPPPAEALAEQRRCLEDNVRWNASQAALGVGAVVRAPGGVAEETALESIAAWLGFAGGPAGTRFLLLGGLRYAWHRHGFDAAGVEGPGFQVAGASGRITFKEEAFLAELQAGVGARKQEGAELGAQALFSLTTSRRITGPLWLELGLSATLESGPTPGRLFALTNVKWGYSYGPRLEKE
jgi:hypothetical protein